MDLMPDVFSLTDISYLLRARKRETTLCSTKLGNPLHFCQSQEIYYIFLGRGEGGGKSVSYFPVLCTAFCRAALLPAATADRLLKEKIWHPIATLSLDISLAFCCPWSSPGQYEHVQWTRIKTLKIKHCIPAVLYIEDQYIEHKQIRHCWPDTFSTVRIKIDIDEP